MPTSWDSLNKKQTTSPSNKWGTLNATAQKSANKQEAMSQKDVDPALYENLKNKGLSFNEIKTPLKKQPVKARDVVAGTAKKIKEGVFKAATKISEQPFLGPKRLPMLGGVLQGKEVIEKAIDRKIGINTVFKNVRGTSQALATPFAAALGAAFPTQGLSRTESSKNAAKESLSMARDMVVKEEVEPDEAISRAAQLWLKNRGVGKYGGKDPDIADYAALGTLQVFNLLGDPAFEFGLGLKGAKSLKEFVTFKKVGSVEKALPEGASIIKNTETPFEINLTDDLKIKVNPKGNEVVFTGYKRRFPASNTKTLDKETTEVVNGIRKATGQELTGRFVGDDLILSPTQPTLLLQAPKGMRVANQVRGEGFVMSEKADQEQLKIYKELQKYQSLLKKYTVNPTEKLRIDLDETKNSIRQMRQSMDSVVAPEPQAPQMSAGVFNRAVSTRTAPEIGQVDVTQPMQATPITPELPQQTEGLKPSKIALDIQSKAIEQKLLNDFGEIAGHEPRVIKEQSDKIAQFIKDDLEDVKKIVRGEEPVPTDISGTYLIKAVEEYALQNNDVGLVQDLIRSPLVSETSRYASELRMARERDRYSPISVITEITNSRRAKAKKGTQKKVTRDTIKEEIKKNTKPIKKDVWEGFIDSITC